MTADLSSRAARGSVGSIGVGLVGTQPTWHLLSPGGRVTRLDIAPGQMSSSVSLGGISAASVAQMGEGYSVAILSLPNSSIGSSVISAITPGLSPKSVVIDTTAGDPEDIAGFAESLAVIGIHDIDATLCGSREQIATDESLVIGGGSADVFDRSGSSHDKNCSLRTPRPFCQGRGDFREGGDDSLLPVCRWRSVYAYFEPRFGSA